MKEGILKRFKARALMSAKKPRFAKYLSTVVT